MWATVLTVLTGNDAMLCERRPTELQIGTLLPKLNLKTSQRASAKMLFQGCKTNPNPPKKLGHSVNETECSNLLILFHIYSVDIDGLAHLLADMSHV